MLRVQSQLAQHFSSAGCQLSGNKLKHWVVKAPEHGHLAAAALLKAWGAVEPALMYGKWDSSAGAPTRTCNQTGFIQLYKVLPLRLTNGQLQCLRLLV